MTAFYGSIKLNNRDYVDVINGLWTGKNPPFEEAYVIRNTNFTNSGDLDTSDIACLQVESKQLSNRILNKGDIILERSGGSDKQPVGRVVYFDIDSDKKYSFSNFTTCLRSLKPIELQNKYLFYCLLSKYKEGYTENLQKRTTGIRNLDFSSYLNLEVPTPNKDIQIKIITVIDTLKSKILLTTIK